MIAPLEPSAGAVLVRPEGRAAGLGVAGLLTAGAVIVGLGGALGVAHSFDGSALGRASGVVWLVLLPPVVAVLLTLLRPAVGLAVVAGAGVLAAGRLLADLPLLTSANTVIRPEFFYETTDRAQPFTAAPGSVIVLVGDVLMTLAGVLAARRLAAVLSFQSDRIFDSETKIDRNNSLITVGFLGVLGLIVAGLALPYQGGYLAARYLPPGLGLWGIAGALGTAVLATGAVLFTSVLPRVLALAALGGAGMVAAVPFLTALAVRATSAPVLLNPVIGIGLAGAVLLAAAGGLARTKLLVEPDREPSPVTIRVMNLLGAVLSLLVGAAALAAWKLPQLRYNGGADPVLSNGFALSAQLPAPYLAAAITPIVGGVLWLIPPLARLGRAVAAIGWAALVFAVAQSLYLLGQLVTSASVPNGVFKPPTWSGGTGLWIGVAGLLVGVAVAVLAGMTAGQAADRSALLTDDDTLAAARRTGAIIAAALTVLTLVALVLPVYRTDAGSGPTLVVGFQVNAWGVLALAVAVVVAAWAAARATSASTAVAYLLAAAAVLVVRQVIPAAARAQEGFRTAPGLIAGYVLIAALLVAAALSARSAARIRMVDPASQITRGIAHQG